MSKYRLTYFDFHGGRGEPARLAFFIGGIAFEDRRVKFPELEDLKPGLPFGSMPTLEVDGEIVSQSNGINRFVGKLAGLYPEDPWQAALCDEIMEAIEDYSHKLGPTFSMPEEEKKKAREALAEGPLKFFLERVEQRLVAHGGEYFADNRLTVADLKSFVWIRHLRSGALDYISTELAGQVAPKLVEHAERIAALPKIVEYYG